MLKFWIGILGRGVLTGSPGDALSSRRSPAGHRYATATIPPFDHGDCSLQLIQRPLYAYTSRICTHNCLNFPFMLFICFVCLFFFSWGGVPTFSSFFPEILIEIIVLKCQWLSYSLIVFIYPFANQWMQYILKLFWKEKRDLELIWGPHLCPWWKKFSHIEVWGSHSGLYICWLELYAK